MSNVFLSYSRKDRNFVERLAEDLNGLGIGVWFDKWEIKVGDSIVEKINKGIEENDYLAIVLSPNSVDSEWVKRELNIALMRQLKEKSVIILPILYKNCKIPPIISDIRYANFTSNYNAGIVELIQVLEKDLDNLVNAISKLTESSGKRKAKVEFFENNSMEKIITELFEFQGSKIQANLLFRLLQKRLKISSNKVLKDLCNIREEGIVSWDGQLLYDTILEIKTYNPKDKTWI